MNPARRDDLALQMAGWIRRHGGDATVVAWTRRLLEERAQGHSCLWLADHAGHELPSLEESREALLDCDLVGDGSEVTPLVLDRDRLALYRDDAAERRLAAAFLERASARVGIEGDGKAFARLYPDATASGAALAAAVALFCRLCVLTGGPGTGKTTAVVRMLALLLAHEPGARIALAAPTGKAAARLEESVREQVEGLAIDEATREGLRVPAVTLHRLLGLAPGKARPRHHAGAPLDADVVVVDEASMVDLQLMDRLLDAIRPESRLILVGDRDQLASVDAGSVLADLVAVRGEGSDARSPALAAAARTLGLEVEEREAPQPLSDNLVELHHNYRYRTRPGIAALAAALRAGDADAALAVFDDAGRDDARRRDFSPARFVEVLDPLLEELPTPEETDPARWLDAIEHRLRVLAATHAGPSGVAALNALVESRLRRAGWSTDERWYRGRPVLVERNHPGLGLANGDLGVCLPDPRREGRLALFVRGAGTDRPRALAVEQLPAHRTAWAMTLHKSQGSEFDHVLITLPPGGHPLLSRELLYTGVTRARQQVTVFADEATLRGAIDAVQHRRTGLAEALRRE